MIHLEAEAHQAWDSGDLPAAFEKFRRIAANGTEGGELNLGFFYDEGLGTPRSKRLAFHWYYEAYRKGLSSGAANIALLFRERGNSHKMILWLERAAAMGDGDAHLDLGEYFLGVDGGARHTQRAIRHLRKAAKSTQVSQAGRERAKLLLRNRTHAVRGELWGGS